MPKGEPTERITINLQEVLTGYNLEGKWNDYIGVQKCVISTLKEEGFFYNNEVINEKSRMVVRISTKGIKETLGKGNRFQNLPKALKQFKVAFIDGVEYGIRVAVKKRISDNIFWIHNIDCNEKSPELLDLRSARIGN